MNRYQSSTRFNRVFINLDLVAKILVIRMQDTFVLNDHLATNISKTVYPDGTIINRIDARYS